MALFKGKKSHILTFEKSETEIYYLNRIVVCHNSDHKKGGFESYYLSKLFIKIKKKKKNLL